MDEAPLARTCPQCSQPLAAGAETCPNCGRDDANPFSAPATPMDPPAPADNHPLLVVTILAIVFVSVIVTFIAPGLGILLGIVFVPAAVRASAVLKRQRAAAAPAAKQVGYFQALLTSAGVMFLVWLAATIAFTIVCFPLGAISWDIRSGPGVGLIVGLVLGFITGLAVFVWLTRRFWPRAAKN